MINRLPNRIVCTMKDGSIRLAESFERLKILKSLGISSTKLIEIAPCQYNEQANIIDSVVMLSGTYDDADEVIADLVTRYHEQVLWKG